MRRDEVGKMRTCKCALMVACVVMLALSLTFSPAAVVATGPPGGGDLDERGCNDCLKGCGFVCLDLTQEPEEWEDCVKACMGDTCPLCYKKGECNLEDPPVGADICAGEEVILGANVSINASDPNDPKLNNVSVGLWVDCHGDYYWEDYAYVNLSGVSFTHVFFTIPPPPIGTCNVETCVDPDEEIKEPNNLDNCGTSFFNVIDCSIREAPISFYALLTLAGLLVVVSIARMRR